MWWEQKLEVRLSYYHLLGIVTVVADMFWLAQFRAKKGIAENHWWTTQSHLMASWPQPFAMLNTTESPSTLTLWSVSNTNIKTQCRQWGLLINDSILQRRTFNTTIMKKLDVQSTTYTAQRMRKPSITRVHWREVVPHMRTISPRCTTY